MAGSQINGRRLPRKRDEELPDSTFPYGPCPRCSGRLSNFTLIQTGSVTFSDDTRYLGRSDDKDPRVVLDRVAVLMCNGCRQNLVVIEQQCLGGVPWRDRRSGGAEEWQGIHWWPAPGMVDNDADVPERVAAAAAEGTRCLSVRAPRAAVVMLRGALAEIVADRGSEQAKAKRSLAAQLQQMGQDRDLDPTLADWAAEIKALGNAGAHPNSLEPITIAEAEDLLRLMNSLLEYLYRVPARLQRSRAARTEPGSS